MQDELPLALVEEQTEREVAAEERRNDGEDDGFDEPDGTDDIRWSGLRGGWPGWFGGGAGHWGFCVDCSILRWAALDQREDGIGGVSGARAGGCVPLRVEGAGGYGMSVSGGIKLGT